MKELKLATPSVASQPIRTQRFAKLWPKAMRRKNFGEQLLRNSNYEFLYHEILQTVKQRYMQPGETYFERDYKYDRVDSISMHSFLIPTFLFQLSCSVNFNYEIEYAFNNCAFETHIREMLRPVYCYGIEIAPRPDFQAYYRAVLNYQPAEHIRIF